MAKEFFHKIPCLEGSDADGRIFLQHGGTDRLERRGGSYFFHRRNPDGTTRSLDQVTEHDRPIAIEREAEAEDWGDALQARLQEDS